MHKHKGQILLQIARDAITAELSEDSLKKYDFSDEEDWLQQMAACFVTLTINDLLRGCIGSLEAHRTLLKDVQQNARAAAFHDPRFPPLTRAELDKISIEISLLSSLKALEFDNEQDALKQVRPGIDGIVFEAGAYRSTFLPQVWQQIPESKDFLAQLKQKAGLASDFWSENVKLFRYTVTKYKESEYPALNTSGEKNV